MQYDISEIGAINCQLNFDEDEYQEYLSDEKLTDTEDTRNYFIREYCNYDVEFLDSDTLHSMDYETMTIDEIEEEFGEAIARDVFEECKDGKEHEYEILAYRNNEIDINNPAELNAEAVKVLRHGGYFKNCRGFILTNGTIVYTDAEHNMCSRISGVKGTYHFIELGNIRLLDHSVDMTKRPTKEQRIVLNQFFKANEGEEVYMDLINDMGWTTSFQYQNLDTSTAFSDIENFYNGQINQRYIVREMKKQYRISESQLKSIISKVIKESLDFRDLGDYDFARSTREYEWKKEDCIADVEEFLQEKLNSVVNEWTQEFLNVNKGKYAPLTDKRVAEIIREKLNLDID